MAVRIKSLAVIHKPFSFLKDQSVREDRGFVREIGLKIS
jgi:hypothetical protein